MKKIDQIQAFDTNIAVKTSKPNPIGGGAYAGMDKLPEATYDVLQHEITVPSTWTEETRMNFVRLVNQLKTPMFSGQYKPNDTHFNIFEAI